ncbi:MAG: single-stranded DNA-binding protein [Flavobacteriales bacterium]|nr:single-stranded DNA-binding protein [Flavobacteriales bacterium]|tara:strand:- start:405 stop:860 length:456 start_codon:yes stop_codon:yes gene_type:complete
MAGVNKVILIGNLGKDPEVRHLESGATVANFPIATTETYKDRNGNRQEQTEWHNIVLWRGLAEIAEKYLKKGNQIYVEGKLRTRSWEDKEGNTRYTTEVVGDNMTMLGGRSDGGSSEGPAATSSRQPAQETQTSQPTHTTVNDEDDDDLPF